MTEARPCYIATAYWSDGWWNITVPDVPGVHTQAQHIGGIHAAARDAVALMLDRPATSFDLRFKIDS